MAFRAGSAGSDGRLGGSVGATSTPLLGVVVLVGFEATFALSASLWLGKALDLSISLYRFSTSSLVRFGGSGGRELASYAGAFILVAVSMEGVLACHGFGAPFDVMEMVDIVEATDSLEAFRLSWSDGLRGGRAGDSCADSFLWGGLRGGAGLNFGFSACSCPVRTMLVGGGRTPSFRGPLGSLPMLEARPWTVAGKAVE